jgi:hypothetical protein
LSRYCLIDGWLSNFSASLGEKKSKY